MPPKLAMSTQPGTTSWGKPARPAAFKRSGPALKTPPHTSSAHSVVVMSSTASTRPSSMSDSWCGRQYQWRERPRPRTRSPPRSRSTHLRIRWCCQTSTPRRSACRRQPVPARPRPCRRSRQRARVKITREIRLTPATSTIDGMSTTSLLPTYAAVSPAATVETHTLGTPTGRARMAAVTRCCHRTHPCRRYRQTGPRRTLAPPPWPRPHP